MAHLFLIELGATHDSNKIFIIVFGPESTTIKQILINDVSEEPSKPMMGKCRSAKISFTAKLIQEIKNRPWDMNSQFIFQVKAVTKGLPLTSPSRDNLP